MSSYLPRKIIIPLFSILLLVISVAWMAGVFTVKTPSNQFSEMPISSSKSFEVLPTLVPKYESAPASLKARETTLISSRILAQINEITVRSGDRVAKGETLALLENTDLQSLVAQSQSRLESIKGTLTEAKNTLTRVESLKEKGLASQAELDQAQAVFTRINGEIQTAQQGQKEAETALEHSVILAPFAGRIVDRKAEPGNMATPGQPILALYNPQSLLIESNVRETLATQLDLGQKLSVYVDSLTLPILAVISELVPAADPNAHSFVVKADIQFEEQLRPGMFARVQIPIGEEPIILIPSEYVENFGQLHRVWINNQGQLSRRFIRVGNSNGDMVEVVSGLEVGERISELIE